jgi:hypothetical protein
MHHVAGDSSEPMTQVRAPFTPEQVRNLFAYQQAGRFHPFTCGNRGDGKHYENGIDLGGLIPTVRGWVCMYCDYKQDWAHEFMTQEQSKDMNI